MKDRLSFAAVTYFWLALAAWASEADDPEAKLRADFGLAELPFKIVYETYRETEGKWNWELCLINADGSDPVLLTNTPAIDELHPHASPDGNRISFLADEVVDGTKSRNVYTMNRDGTGRSKIADNGRDQCWGPDSKTIAYLQGEFPRFTTTDYASKGLFFHDIQTGETRQHPNAALHHLYCLCWSPDGKWFVATVHGGMGFRHAVLAFPADGVEVFDLSPANGCRPDLDPDQRMMTWLRSDTQTGICDIRLDGGQASVANVRTLAKCDEGHEIYHPDWSPDGRWIAVGYGPRGGEAVGTRAPGWNICVIEVKTGKRVAVTTDGRDNKEPDWVPITAADGGTTP